VKVGDLVSTTGYCPEGKTASIGLIVKPSNIFPRTWIVHWASSGHTTVYAQDGMEVINESR